MSSGISSIFNISSSSLQTNSEALRVTGNNIANVNTEGYSRRRVEIKEQTPFNLNANSFGTGVAIEKVVRLVDDFVNDYYRFSISDRAEAEVRSEILGRAESPFVLADSIDNIGFNLNEFFSSLEDLSLNPSSTQLRQNVLLRGQSLTESIQTSYNGIAELQREVDSRIQFGVTEVNRIAGEIDKLNDAIGLSEFGDQQNLALRDQRDKLLTDLSELISYNRIELSDGRVFVSLGSGFPLVAGDTQPLDFTIAPSFTPPGGYPGGLDGDAMGHIVFDFDSTAGISHIDLTNVIAAGDGLLAGLLNLRGLQADNAGVSLGTTPFDAIGDLPEIGTRIEYIARELLTTFNQTYLGDDPSTAGVNLAGEDEDPGTPFFDPSSGDANGNPPPVFGLFSFSGAADVTLDGLPTDADLTALATLLGRRNFASILSFGVQSADALAVGLDLDVATVGSTSFAPGDASNINRLLQLRDRAAVLPGFGNFSPIGTISDIYAQSMVFIGGLKSSAEGAFQLAADREIQAQQLQANISAVSLDEEFADLIKFQRSFQASARLVRTGDELFQDILALIG